MQTMGVIRPQGYQEKYGISQESFTQIQRQASQTPSSIASPQPEVIKENDPQLTLTQSQVINRLADALQFQATQFDRFREISERKFTTLSKDLLDVTMQLKESNQLLAKLRDKHEVAAAREAMHSYQRGDKPAAEKAIDRNGVAPSAVQIENIFNCSGKRF